ncbi:hypothetical protein [Helicobacter cinaedi]|uniref:Uncharacterized protein n=2 Tax=Helicobacter cinaedi TaxID=213 RepID=A0A377JV94_9HELI|nr:hypothetical protein [Helicobacter cinaedi]STP13356.1 Uncharacterised protein [Helicobacter cinaedi]STP13770.1 Uncharacterised protein [Helicobacter cinaedi]STP13786.1 Uncharacterised protein [Helicobacter cinaedi]
MQHINQNPLQTNEWSYTNNTDSAQNIIVTLNGGDGALSKSTWVESDWTKYWSAGARGVSVQCFINDTLQEVAQGGLGNPQSVANQKVYSHTEGYKCGRYWYGAVKWCDRAVYVWGSQRAFPRGGSGDTKSFALNLGAGEVLKIVFVGGANITNTLFNGSVSLSFIPQTAPVIPEVPEVEPSPESPETELPEVDSSENAENTEQETLPALSREQILAYQSFLGDFMEFFTQNQNQKITENMTFLDYYNANKSEANEPYESFLSSQLMANGGSIIMRDFLADFMQSTESELVEFFANMPQTQHKDGDLLDLSYFELIGLLGEQGGDSSQGNTESENTENENPPIVEPESPQEQEPTISAEMRAEARKLTEAMQSYQTFLNQNQATTITYNSHFLPQYNGTPIPYRLVIMGRYQMAYDEFVNTAMLSTIAYKQFWQELPTTPNNDYERDLKACGMLELDSVIHKNLLELNYPQLLEIVNGGSGDSTQETTPPEVDSNENIESEPQEPLPEVEAPQEPQTQEQKLARIQEIKQNALVSEFLSFKGFFETLLSDEVIANQTEPVKLVYGWFREWILNPLNLTRLEDIPASHDFNTDSGANIAMAKWVAKIENINEIYADLQGKGLEVSLNDFKNFIICIMMSVNSQRDSFESERNRYVEIYAMPEIRALIDELEKLEAEVL